MVVVTRYNTSALSAPVLSDILCVLQYQTCTQKNTSRKIKVTTCDEDTHVHAADWQVTASGLAAARVTN
jgi:hypothetical protein